MNNQSLFVSCDKVLRLSVSVLNYTLGDKCKKQPRPAKVSW